jgi:hypothetical protein
MLNGGEPQARSGGTPKAKAIHTGKPGDRFDITPCLLKKLETLYTGLLADAQLFDDLLVRLRITPF